MITILLKNKEKGFTLVETMVVSGILGGLALVISQMIVMQKNQTSKAEINYAKMEVQRSVVEFLKTKEVCSFLLNSDDANIKSIRTPTTPNFQASTAFPYKISFKKILASIDPTSTAIFEVGKSASSLSELLKIKDIYFNLKKYSNSFPRGELFADFHMEFEPIKNKTPDPIILKNIQIKAEKISANSLTYEVSKCGLWDHVEHQRITFNNIGKEIEWKVPDGVTRIFVTMAGGGGSGYGWKITDDLQTGHTGGFVLNKTLKVNPGEIYLIKVGYGGRGILFHDRTPTSYNSGGLYKENPLFNKRLGDPTISTRDLLGLIGFGGGSSYIKLKKSGSIPLIECSGGRGAYPETGKYKEAFPYGVPLADVSDLTKSDDYIPYTGNDKELYNLGRKTYQGFKPGLYVNSNNSPSINIPVTQEFVKSKLTVLNDNKTYKYGGVCAESNGISGTGTVITGTLGEQGNKFSEFASGLYNGADTALGYGNGGDVKVYNGNVAYHLLDNKWGGATGPTKNTLIKGRLILPQPGRDGIVYIDIW